MPALTVIYFWSDSYFDYTKPMSISEDDIRKVCAVCQVVYGGNPKGKYDSHGYCLACYEGEMKKFGFETRMPLVVGSLTERQFVSLMESQDESGKHGILDTSSPHDWDRVANYASEMQILYASSFEKPFLILDRVPLQRLCLGHPPENPELIQQYGATPGEFPPVYVSLPKIRYEKIVSYQLPPHAIVINGNHRLKAAQRRRDKNIPAIVNQETWHFYQKLFPSS